MEQISSYNFSLLITLRYPTSLINWEAAADFVVENRNVLLEKVGKDSRFKYIERPDWNAVEFKTDNTLIYFLKPLASAVYINNNGNQEE